MIWIKTGIKLFNKEPSNPDIVQPPLQTTEPERFDRDDQSLTVTFFLHPADSEGRATEEIRLWRMKIPAEAGI